MLKSVFVKGTFSSIFGSYKDVVFKVKDTLDIWQNSKAAKNEKLKTCTGCLDPHKVNQSVSKLNTEGADSFLSHHYLFGKK